jgi:hypothetical protein
MFDGPRALSWRLEQQKAALILKWRLIKIDHRAEVCGELRPS